MGRVDAVRWRWWVPEQRGNLDALAAGDPSITSNHRHPGNHQYRHCGLVVSSRTDSAALAFLMGRLFKRGDLLARVELHYHRLPRRRDGQLGFGRYARSNDVFVDIPQRAEGPSRAKASVRTNAAGLSANADPAVVKHQRLIGALNARGCRTIGQPRTTESSNRTTRARQLPAPQSVRKACRRLKLCWTARPRRGISDGLCARTRMYHRIRPMHGSSEASVGYRVTPAEAEADFPAGAERVRAV
jgi:hypothetical protein